MPTVVPHRTLKLRRDLFILPLAWIRSRRLVPRSDIDRTLPSKDRRRVPFFPAEASRDLAISILSTYYLHTYFCLPCKLSCVYLFRGDLVPRGYIVLSTLFTSLMSECFLCESRSKVFRSFVLLGIVSLLCFPFLSFFSARLVSVSTF